MDARAQGQHDLVSEGVALRALGPRAAREVHEEAVAHSELALLRREFQAFQVERERPRQLLCERCGTVIVRADVEVELAAFRRLGELHVLHLRLALQVDLVLVRGQLPKHPLGNQAHRHVLEGREAIPLDRLLLEELVEDMVAPRQLGEAKHPHLILKPEGRNPLVRQRCPDLLNGHGAVDRLRLEHCDHRLAS